MLTWPDCYGLAGVTISTACYARVQWQRDYAKTLNYSLLNVLGSVLLMISIIENWNFASFVSNTLWGTISLYGVYRCVKYLLKRDDQPIVKQ